MGGQGLACGPVGRRGAPGGGGWRRKTLRIQSCHFVPLPPDFVHRKDLVLADQHYYSSRWFLWWLGPRAVCDLSCQLDVSCITVLVCDLCLYFWLVVLFRDWADLLPVWMMSSNYGLTSQSQDYRINWKFISVLSEMWYFRPQQSLRRTDNVNLTVSKAFFKSINTDRLNSLAFRDLKTLFVKWTSG
jgi:hypothetical protein